MVPATYTFKQHGKRVKESGSTVTVALKKSGTEWRITAWAWSKH